MKGKTKIKKIDNKAARQVAFSKRRRGLFSKAEQLSRLCDVKIAIIIFSMAGRPYSYSSSSMKEIISNYELTSKKSQRQESELLNRNYAMLCEEVAKKSQELRQLKGEGLEGLGIEQLQSLEDTVDTSIKIVRQRIQDDFFMTEIKTLQQKQAEMLEENNKLKELLLTKQLVSEKEQALDLQEISNGMQEFAKPNTLQSTHDSSITLQLRLAPSTIE